MVGIGLLDIVTDSHIACSPYLTMAAGSSSNTYNHRGTSPTAWHRWHGETHRHNVMWRDVPLMILDWNFRGALESCQICGTANKVARAVSGQMLPIV